MLSDLDDEQDYFDTLGAFVEKYEKEHHAIPDATEGGILRMLMEGREWSQSQLSRETGIPQSTISAVLNGTRRMTRDQIEKFAAFFRKSPALFMPRVDDSGDTMNG